MSEQKIDQTQREVLDDGVILCVRLSGDVDVVESCRAAVRGGLRVLEITLTTPGALRTMKTLSGEGEALVGAGTTLSRDDVRAAAEAGARFVLSPVLDPDVVDEARTLGLLAIPGAATPAEILAAHRHGARLVKVFPAAALGGPSFLRAVRGPLPNVSIIPTNGPTAETLADYVAAGAVAVGVGGEVFPEGFTPQSVEVAARKVRDAMHAARSPRP